MSTPPPVFDPRDQSPDRLLAWTRSQGVSDEVGRRLLACSIGRGRLDVASWGREFGIPHRLTQDWPPLPRLSLDRAIRSPRDGFEKLRFLTPDGLAIETVLIPLHKPGSVSVCLSSQVGCSMACTFCATARMPDRRNLATWEILDQFLQARARVQDQGRRVSGVVFMGMGEPFLNYDRVLSAAELLSCPFGAAVGARAITISTVGIVPAIDDYTREGHRYRLSISLGAASDEKRARLVPVAARWPVSEVMDAARRYALSRRQRVNLSYVCISGENVGEDDAEALGRLIGDTPTRLDLIDVTDPTGRYSPPSAEELKAFRDALTRHVRQPVARRMEGDIGGCGTGD